MELKPSQPTVLIDPSLKRPKAMIAAMMAAAHGAAAKVAAGATWEDDQQVVIAPSERAHALRMAQIWRHATTHLERCEERPSLSGSAHGRAGPVRSVWE